MKMRDDAALDDGFGAVMDMRNDAALDKDFEDVWGEVMANFEEGCKEGVSTSHNMGYMMFPAQSLIEQNIHNFDILLGLNLAEFYHCLSGS